MIKNKAWWLAALRGLLLTIIGIFLLFQPIESITGLLFFMGFALLASGGALALLAVINWNKSTSSPWTFLEGLIDMAIGTIFIVYPNHTVILMTFLIGSLILLSAVYKILFAWRFKEALANWKNFFWNGLVLLSLSLLIFFNPFASLMSVGVLAGIGLLYFGGVQMYDAYLRYEERIPIE